MLRVETVFTGRAPLLGFTSLERQISSRLCILSMIWGEISVVWICISASVFFFLFSTLDFTGDDRLCRLETQHMLL